MEQDQEDDQRIKGGHMNNFSVKAVYKGVTLEFDVEAVNIDDALEEGRKTAKMVYEQTFGDLNISEIYVEVCTI